MYIPPIIDPAAGVIGNQLLFEKKMSEDLNISKRFRVLDIGCGRGRVAMNLASVTGAEFVGINIDQVQLESAENFARANGLSNQCKFLNANFNDPLPFADNSFDCLYQIQVLTYAKDKEKLFREMFRVLKPGGRLSFLDWVRLDRFDPNNVLHQSLMRRVKPLIGAVDTPSGEEIASLLEKAGFKVCFSADASVGGHQADLIEEADRFFRRTRWAIKTLVTLKLLPRHFNVLFDRLTKDGDAFIEADRLGLFTTSHQTLAQKPHVLRPKNV